MDFEIILVIYNAIITSKLFIALNFFKWRWKTVVDFDSIKNFRRLSCDEKSAVAMVNLIDLRRNLKYY